MVKANVIAPQWTFSKSQDVGNAANKVRRDARLAEKQTVDERQTHRMFYPPVRPRLKRSGSSKVEDEVATTDPQTIAPPAIDDAKAADTSNELAILDQTDQPPQLAILDEVPKLPPPTRNHNLHKDGRKGKSMVLSIFHKLKIIDYYEALPAHVHSKEKVTSKSVAPSANLFCTTLF
jgi:hypothetical protein